MSEQPVLPVCESVMLVFISANPIRNQTPRYYTMRTLQFLVIAVLFAACTPKAQPPQLSTEEVLQLVDEQNYQFNLEFVRPMGGRQRLITGTYFMRVQKELIECDLPYIGRAFQAPIGSTDNGMKFSSRNFGYTSTTGKGERREITIQPKDEPNIREVFLIIFSNGKADLRINSNNRQTISYTGTITALPPQK